MNYANMIEEKNLKKTFIIATLMSTIIGTFTTGINLYERVGERRKQKKKDTGQDQRLKELEEKISEVEKKRQHHQRNEDDLRRSLEHGGPMVRQEYNRDLARIGPRFAEGDSITQNQLQSQIIMLQGTVIGLLEDALYTGRIADVNKLYNASEFAREGSIRALRDQYQRMLQAAPLRRPIGPVRRISSTPSMKPGAPRSMAGAQPAIPPPPTHHSTHPAPPPSHHTSHHTTHAPSVRGEAVVKEERTVIEAPPANGSVKETAALASLDSSGPLFCRYAVDMQNGAMPLDECFSKGGSQACPLCGTRIPVEAGRAWRVEKEIVHERINTPTYEDEVIEERTYLLGNRFIVKCHREKAGFACVLCYRYRDRDTICESIGGLVKHVWAKHDVAEYESDPDIKEVGTREEIVRKDH